MRDWKDIRDEVRQHAADVRRDALRQGRSAEEADLIANAELASLVVLASQLPRPRWWTGAGLDLGHAWRLMKHQRGYSMLIIVTLAIAIGGCTTVYSLFRTLLLQPLPFPAPDRLVLLWETQAGDPETTFVVAAPNYIDWVANTRSYTALGIWAEITFNVAAAGEPEQVAGLRASSSLFAVLGVAPQLGRVFTAEEEQPGHAVAVISDGVWRAHFGGRRDVLDQSIRLNGENHRVIGVMPPDFEFPYRGAGIWVPIAFTRQDQERGAHSFLVAGRLADGVALRQAKDEIERLADTLRQRHTENTGESATAILMAEYGLQNTRGTLIALSGAVGLVLIIACVNVASLQVALGLARRREFVTRLALGASRTRLSRQLLAEALVIAAIGCGGGIAVSWLATRTLELLLPPGFLRLPFRGDINVTLDTTVVAFAAIVSFISALLFAFAPMLGLKGDSLQPALRDGARGATRSAATTRRVLVTAEIALAIVVLVGAGLMMRSMLHLLAVQPGLDPHNVLSMRVSLPQHDTYGAPERTDFCRNLAREVGSLPGVMQVSAVSHLPLGGSNASRAITIEGRPEPPPDSIASAAYRLACPGYFAALGIRLIAGRDFTDSDSLNAPRVVIVNRTLVERYWKDGDALGQRLKIGGYRSGNPYLTIIGIVDSVRHFGLDAGPSREIFLPYSQQAWPVMTIVAKTAGDPLIWDRQVRAALTRVESSLPAAQTRVMEDVVRQSVGWREAPMRLLTAFAVIGLLLAAIGVYGVLAYYVSQRTREFGVRTALGASRRTLVALVLRQSATPIAVGTGLGVAASFAATTLLSRFLYEVQPGDPVVLASVVALLTLVALFSSWLPARRAAAIDPITALRNE